ncbi:MAG TPA: Gfo/Idh/MocA family oxidoreductase [Roseiarcus sp.]|nr:Gfo/Idh/MocA family oxidoreductase [Roseiarcus sp.]
MARIKVAVIGVGKIAQDQHLPVIAGNADYELVGVVSQRGVHAAGAPTFATPAELYAVATVDAVAICTPPHVRHALARQALDAGKHVMLEKPPAATLAEMHDLTAAAKAAGRVMLATWHSRYNAAVDAAKARLKGQRLKRLAIEWKEDVRRWHPGQNWIWDAGNFGVFDPGINALSILTKIAPTPLFVKSAKLLYPENRDTPIAASLVFTCPAAAAGAPLSAEFDWRQEGEQSWNIDIETEDGVALRLTHGGSRLLVNGAAAVTAPMQEYEGIYAHFAELLRAGESEMDFSPFQLVGDAFLVGSRRVVPPFLW